MPLGFAAIADEAPAPAADPGVAGYRAHCASCHDSALTGRFGPPLIGADFQRKWRAAAAPGLFGYIKAKMPPANPGSLPDDLYRQISDFVARRNGLPSAAGGGATLAEGGASSAATAEQRINIHLVRPSGKPDAYYDAVLARRQALLAHMSPVTDALLRDPPDGDWPMWRRALDTLGYSPLRQVNRANAGRLTLGWSLSLAPGTNAIAPLVHDGVMLLDASNTVMALDATSGDLLWSYAGRPVTTERVPISQPRGIALYGTKVFVPTLDGHVVALDMRTGALLWDHRIFPREDGLELTAGPLAAHGKVFQGVAGCSGSDYRGGCYIVALDAETGNEAWRFHTIARPGQPGEDSWNGAPVEDRYGSSVWTAGSYDPDTNLVYFGTGQTYSIATLLQPNKRKGASADALFTDSTLALDADTGRLAWYHQHLPGDVWDLDWAFERSLITLDGPGGPRRAVVTGGKDSIFDAIDARTGQYLFSVDLGIQTLVTAIDPVTGRKQINPKARFSPGHDGMVCPYNTGGRNWPATAYDPHAGLLFVPMVESCMGLSFPATNDVAGWKAAWRLLERPDSDGKYGRISAVDLRRRRIVWTDRRRAPPASAMLATAGGIVFEGSRDRTFRALDSATGATLWETPLSDTPNGFPITYEVDGIQYVAIVLGGGTPQDIVYRSLTPEIASSTGARSIWVFRLPDRRK